MEPIQSTWSAQAVYWLKIAFLTIIPVGTHLGVSVQELTQLESGLVELLVDAGTVGVSAVGAVIAIYHSLKDRYAPKE